MTTRERALRVIHGLPENATLDEILDRLRDLERESAQDPMSTPQDGSGQSAWDLLRSSTGAVEMPADWATEHDHYLYGTPKRSSRS